MFLRGCNTKAVDPEDDADLAADLLVDVVCAGLLHAAGDVGFEREKTLRRWPTHLREAVTANLMAATRCSYCTLKLICGAFARRLSKAARVLVLVRLAVDGRLWFSSLDSRPYDDVLRVGLVEWHEVKVAAVMAG